MRKMNYLYANVRSMCQATMLPEPGGAAPYVLKQTSDESVFSAGLFRPSFPGDREAMEVWMADGGVFGDRAQFWRDHVAG
jgi:hypothetical protein